MRLGDLRRGHSSRSASTSRASSRASRTVTSQLPLRRQRLPHRRRHHRLLARSPAPAVPTSPPPFSHGGCRPPRTPRRSRAAALQQQPPPRRRPHSADRRLGRRPATADPSSAPGSSPRCHPPADRSAAVSPTSSVVHPSTSSSTIAQLARRRDQPHPLRQRIHNMSSATPTRRAPARPTSSIALGHPRSTAARPSPGTRSRRSPRCCAATAPMTAQQGDRQPDPRRSDRDRRRRPAPGRARRRRGAIPGHRRRLRETLDRDHHQHPPGRLRRTDAQELAPRPSTGSCITRTCCSPTAPTATGSRRRPPARG